jgi:hypothetical protein
MPWSGLTHRVKGPAINRMPLISTTESSSPYIRKGPVQDPVKLAPVNNAPVEEDWYSKPIFKKLAVIATLIYLAKTMKQ